MLLIYSEKTSPRLKYVLDFIFKETAGTEYEFTTDRFHFEETTYAKINFSQQRIDKNEFFLKCTPFIFGNDLSIPSLNVQDFEDTKALFSLGDNSDFPFDVFGAVFFMLSRFEEYQPYIRDAHGRFKPSESIASKNGFLGKPVVNIWIKHFFEYCNNKLNLNLSAKKNKFNFINTIDIDMAYSYRNKGLYRNFFGFARAIKNIDIEDFMLRASVISGRKRDPFDSFDYILDIHSKYNLKTIFFVHVGDYGTYDKNIPYKNSKFRDLIRHLADYADIGIHPSYSTFTKPEKLEEEIDRLSEIVRNDITKSRQHFLLLKFPGTYRNLVDNRIKEDYTMGYASEIGFRAGVTTPFYFFDLDANKPTSLKIRPFSMMEGTLLDYQKKNKDEAVEILATQIEEIKKVQGDFISLWHNESLGNMGRWSGWREVYENMINMALK